MSKKKKLLIFSIAALLVVGVIVLIGQLTKEKPLEYTYNHSSNTVASIESGDYATYVSELKKYLGIAATDDIKTPQNRVVINGVDYYGEESLVSTTATVNKQTITAKTSAGLNYIGEGDNKVSLENIVITSFWNINFVY